MNTLTKKIITTITAAMVTISSFGSIPALAFAKENHGADVSATAKLNHGQTVSAAAHIEHDDEDKGNFGLGIGQFLSVNGLSTVTPTNLQIFKQAMKDAKSDQKEAKKDARSQFKTDIKAATTQDEKTSAVKTYLTSLLNAFKAFAAAKEAALTQFINSLGGSVNHTPVANAQSVTVAENNSVNITLTGSDSDGNSLTYMVVTSTSHGTLTGTAPNLTYTPNTNFNGSDSFTFKVSDGSLVSTTATVSITVTGVNQAPTANAQTITIAKNASADITLTGSDPEGSTLTFMIVTNPVHGTLSGTVPNLMYLPATDYSGSDSFTFKVNDGSLDSTTATVSITVNP